MDKANVSRIWAMHEGDSLHFLIGSIGALFVGGANPAVGIIFVKCMWFFYGVEASAVRTDSYIWSSVMIGVSLAQIIGDTARGWGFGVPGEKLTVKLRTLFYHTIMRQEIAWHDQPEHDSGVLCADLASEARISHPSLRSTRCSAFSSILCASL